MKERRDMTRAIVSNPSETRELGIDELDEAGGGIFPVLIAVAAFEVGFMVGWTAGAIYSGKI
jgi:hypothetical protein